jgi:hypothetical protein
VSETYLGDYALRNLIAEDAFGSLHRAVRVEEGRLLRHALVRRFTDPQLRAAAGARVPEATQLSLHLGDLRGLMPHGRIYPAPEPFLSYDYPPGRTLAQVLAACRAQGMPLGLEHTLTVLRDLAITLDQLHGNGLEQGLLEAELVWVTFEGAVMWLDVPFMGLYRERSKEAAPEAGWAGDLRQLARLGWRMLGGESGAAGLEDLSLRLDRWTDVSGDPLDPRLKRLFRRMVGLEAPFADREAFHQEAGELLRAGVHEPSTFSLSLLMHTLFREAIDQETRAMAVERTALFEGPTAAAKPALATKPRRSGMGWGVAAAAAVLLCAGGWVALRQRGQEAETLKLALAEASKREAELEQAAADAKAKAAVQAAPPAAASAAQEPAQPAPVEPPKPTPSVKTAPAHPDAPQIPGRARVKVYVNEQGRALRAMVLESSSPAAAEAAQQAALKATYRPVIRDGRPARDWVEVVLGAR